MKRNNKKCANKSCGRVRDWSSQPSEFCARHKNTASTATGRRSAARKRNTASKAKRKPRKKVDPTTRFKGVLEEIHPTTDHLLISRTVEETCEGERGSGVRSLIPLQGGVLDVQLKALSRQAIDSVEGLRYSELVVIKPMVVRAPPDCSQSNSWSTGPMHPDQWEYKKSGLYTCIYFVDEVTAENGAIRFWPYTARVPFDRNNPVAKDEPSRIITGEAGTLLVFDSRIVHQSLPNKTEEKRDTITWFLCAKRNAKAFKFYV